MKLYIGPLSLFSRKVEIALAEKGLTVEQVVVPFSQEAGYSPKHPDVVALNPKGQVPVLVDGDLTLYDSTVILEYLEDAVPDPPLYPREPRERAQCRLLELHADEVLLVPLRALMHRTERRAHDPVRWDALEAATPTAEAKLAQELAAFDARLADRRFFCGAYSVADIALFMAVLYCLRLGGPSLRATPALAAWFGSLAARPAVAPIVAAIEAADRSLSVPVPQR